MEHILAGNKAVITLLLLVSTLLQV